MLVKDAVAEFLHSRRAMACTKSTIATYDAELGRLLGRFLDIKGVEHTEQITVPVLTDYMAWTHNRGVSVNTLISMRRRVGVFVSWCGLQGYCEPDIMKAIPKPRPRFYLRRTHTQEEVQAILKTAHDPRLYHPYDSQELTSMILLLLDTGMRLGELVGLTVGDLNNQDGLIRVRGKGDKERLVRISHLTQESFASYLEMRRFTVPEQPLFISRGYGMHSHNRGGPVTDRAIYQRIRRLGAAAGVPTSPHKWRHTFAVFALRNGANVKALQHFLGHSALQTTDNYLRGFGYEDAARDHVRFSPVDALMKH